MDNRERMNLRIKKRHDAAKINGIYRVDNLDALNQLTGKEFQAKVIALDGKCMNPACTTGQSLQAHHIPFKSQGGKNIVEHGITLCMECHDKAHGRIAGGGDNWMLLTLVYWINKDNWRWDEAFWWLVKRLSLKGKDYALIHQDDGRRVVNLNGKPVI